MKTLKVVVEVDDDGAVHQVYLNKSLAGTVSVQILRIHEETPEQQQTIDEELFPLIPMWLPPDPVRPPQA